MVAATFCDFDYFELEQAAIRATFVARCFIFLVLRKAGCVMRPLWVGRGFHWQIF